MSKWFLVLALIGCGGETATPEPAPEPAPAVEPAPAAPAKDSPEGLAATANEIAKDPSKQAEILAAAGWTAADYEAALVAVAADPAKSAAYAAARK